MSIWGLWGRVADKLAHPYKAEHRRIMELLAGHGESTGLELVQRSGGLIKRGAVYVHLRSLIEGGWVYRTPGGTYILTKKARDEDL